MSDNGKSDLTKAELEAIVLICGNALIDLTYCYNDDGSPRCPSPEFFNRTWNAVKRAREALTREGVQPDGCHLVWDVLHSVEFGRSTNKPLKGAPT